jgi:putative endonuclease
MSRGLSNYKKGMNAEMIVNSYLIRHGYSVVKHRYKTQYGEIDLIATKGNLILFTEVKNRKSIFDREIISDHQKKRCCETASYFLSQNQQFLSFTMRFDCFFIDRHGKLEHIENAWEITDFRSLGAL